MNLSIKKRKLITLLENSNDNNDYGFIQDNRPHLNYLANINQKQYDQVQTSALEYVTIDHNISIEKQINL